MATEPQDSSTDETPGQEQEQEQQGSQSETPEAPQQVTVDDSTQLPDTHPLVKTLAKQKQDIAAHKAELAEARAHSAKATQLQEELDKRPTTEAMETLQTRFDRLEAFAQAVGLGKALDSRTFTKDLFESDKDVKDLVKEWNKANPSATSAALGSSGGDAGGSGKEDPNKLLRIAAGKK